MQDTTSEGKAQTPPVAAPSFNLDTSLSHLLHRAHQISGDIHTQVFGLSGLTQRQTAVLAALSSGAGLSQTELVKKTGIDRSTLAEMVARMEAKGLVARTKTQTDARIKTVTLLPEGQLAWEGAQPHLVDNDATLLSRLPSNGARDLIKLLSRLAAPEAQAEQSGTAKPKKKKEKKKKDRKKK